VLRHGPVTPQPLLESAPSPPANKISLIKEALRGSRRDLTAMPVGQAILFLAVPMVIEMLMEAIFAIVDIFWVGRLGTSAVATVTLTESMLVLIYAAAMGLSIGCTAMVARRIGEQQPEKASSAAAHGIGLGIALGLIVGVLGVALAPALLKAMGGAPEVVAGATYTRVMLGGSVTVVLLFIINAAFRGAGDPAISMRVLALANGINIVLGPLLIFGVGPFPKLGMSGAAVATTIGRGIGVVYQLRALTSGRGRLLLGRQHLRIDPPLMRTILRISRSAVVQVFIGTASWMVLVRVIATFGTDALAGYQIAIRTVLFAILPSWGLANAAATLVGQNLGAGRPEQAERAVWKAAYYNFLVLGSVGVLFFAGADLIIGLFTSDPPVHAYGVRCLRIVAAGFPLYAFGMAAIQAFNGAGNTRTPTWVNVICFWAFEIPLALLTSRTFGWGPTGVFVSITLAFCLMAVISVPLFRKGDWKNVKV
jgi:putative MATE family efflux protein